jgi:hypothetical protein
MSIAKILASPEAQAITSKIEVWEQALKRIETANAGHNYEILLKLNDGGPDLAFTPDQTETEAALNSCYCDFMTSLSIFLMSKKKLAEKELQKLIRSA